MFQKNHRNGNTSFVCNLRSCLWHLCVMAVKMMTAMLIYYASVHIFHHNCELFNIYQTLAISWPIVTKAFTSGIAYFVGDVIAQRFEGVGQEENVEEAPLKEPNTFGKVDASRVARSTIVGFVAHGPQLHAWGVWLESFVVLGTSPLAKRSAVFVKILLDQTIFTMYWNGSYCAFIEILRGASMREAWHSVYVSAWPSLRSSWCFWPLVHTVTYSVMPIHLRVLWIDVVEIVWVAILSTIAASSVAVTSNEKAREGLSCQVRSPRGVDSA